jgi:hypothetical protein
MGVTDRTAISDLPWQFPPMSDHRPEPAMTGVLDVLHPTLDLRVVPAAFSS